MLLDLLTQIMVSCRKLDHGVRAATKGAFVLHTQSHARHGSPTLHEWERAFTTTTPTMSSRSRLSHLQSALCPWIHPVPLPCCHTSFRMTLVIDLYAKPGERC